MECCSNNSIFRSYHKIKSKCLDWRYDKLESEIGAAPPEEERQGAPGQGHPQPRQQSHYVGSPTHGGAQDHPGDQILAGAARGECEGRRVTAGRAVPHPEEGGGGQGPHHPLSPIQEGHQPYM